jgi:hypothetical protein
MIELGATRNSKEAYLAGLMSFDWIQILVVLFIIITFGFWAKLFIRFVIAIAVIGCLLLIFL